jgi:anti-sigma regulatory factor (Ser/Thr protein kinase)
MRGPVSPTRPAVLKLKLPCELRQVRPAAVTTRRFLLEHGCAENEALDFEMALVEACNNGIQHAAPNARHQTLSLETQCHEQFIELRLTDHTPGFDWPAKVPLPDSNSESGRGIYLIQALMDECRYEKGAGENTLVLRKKRIRPKPAST